MNSDSAVSTIVRDQGGNHQAKAPHAKAPPAGLNFASPPTARAPTLSELELINSLHIEPATGRPIAGINALNIVLPKPPPPPPPKAGGLLARGDIPRIVRFGETSVAPPMEVINSVGPSGAEARAILQARMLHRQGYPALRGPWNQHRANIADPNHPAPVHRDTPSVLPGGDDIMIDVDEPASSMPDGGRAPPSDSRMMTSAEVDSRNEELRADRRRSRRQVQIDARLDASLGTNFGDIDTSSEEMEVRRTRAGGPGHPWEPAQPKASLPGRVRRGMEDV